MERALSLEDKIRKAEEIYYRRNNVKLQNTYSSHAKQDIKSIIIKRITIQTLVAACVFTGVFAFLNNDTHSDNTKNIIHEILSYNIDFQSIYNKVVIKENSKANEEIENAVNEENVLYEEIVPNDELIQEVETLGVEEETNIDVPIDDVQYIKDNISLIKPLEGIITSRFGFRENVEPLYHTGIDIAANTGTPIVSAMDGIAQIVSTEGSYGKHIKIVSGEVSTLYAHCSELFIKEGDVIKQGDKIAAVGSTGNATGPHLHFEIMRNDKYINPDEILDF